MGAIANDDTWPWPTDRTLHLGPTTKGAAAGQSAQSARPDRAAAPSAAPSLPAWIGRFRPLARVRIGPLAEVFVARCDRVDGTAQLAAVKRIHPSLHHVAEARALFAHEAQLLARFDHRSIPKGLELSAAADEGWFATEHVRGHGLIEVVRRAEQLGLRVPLRHAIAIVASIAEALDHVHGANGADDEPLGVVHTDVTPSNITVADDGVVKLIDFGAAQSRLRSTATRTRPHVGRVAYMSPEQSRGEPVDRRSDVYALGVVLWELATWSRLYPRLAPEQVLARVAIGAVPLPSQIRADIPSELEDVMMIALQPAAQRRFSGAGELAKVLRRLGGSADPRGLDAWIRRVFH